MYNFFVISDSPKGKQNEDPEEKILSIDRTPTKLQIEPKM
jgi:hypothetical protein